jgi:exonuclease III
MHILRGMESSVDEMKDLWTDSGNLNYSYIYRQEKIRLDHVLVNSNFISKIKNQKILNEDLYEEEKPRNVWHDTKIVGSDHACVYFEVEGF